MSGTKALKRLPKQLSNVGAALEHQRLTSLINSMGDGVIAVDEKINIVLYNGAALNILDVNASMENKPLKDILQLINPENQAIDIHTLITSSTTSTTSRDLRLKYNDGTLVNVYLSIAPVHLGYGQSGQRGYVLLLRDITREKSLEEERDEFISVVSHELRTPIAIAEGNVGNAQYLLEKNGDTSQIVDALKQAHDQISFLAGLINDLSTLSRAERGKLELEIEPINAHDLCVELVANYTPQAKAKGLQLTAELNSNLSMLYSSKLYTREILQNFITNAIKYTQEGSVTLGAESKQDGIQFWVRDTGIGISKTDQEKVFDKFFRSEDYRTRENSGTGLGLYVTMKLVRKIHAEIDVESEINKGSTFIIYVPNLKDVK